MTLIRPTVRQALACLAVTATVIVTAITLTPQARATTTTPHAWPASWQAALSRPADVPPGRVFPLWRLARGAHPGSHPGLRASVNTIGEPGGYDPAELRAYLGLRGTGAGQTVAVTEAFNMRPSVTAALARYDSWYGLPPACSATVTTGCFNLTFAAPDGTIDTSPNVLAWPVEADLDVEMIHALVPRAAIAVVEGRDDAVTSMMAAVGYAQSLHPAAISNSWTADEFAGEQSLDGRCPAVGAICVFSSGDSGNYASCIAQGGTGCGGYPAADRGVLAVGGTTLDLAANGKVRSETAWAGSGGGISRYEPFPGYQRTADHWHSGRGIPDVSFDADPNSGFALYESVILYYKGKRYDFCTTAGLHVCGWHEVGGTSVSAPAWAAILASAAQLRAAAGKPPLTIADVHAAVYATAGKKPVADITVGENGVCDPLCSAGAGYDLVTGEGSPRQGIDTYLASRSPR